MASPHRYLVEPGPIGIQDQGSSPAVLGRKGRLATYRRARGCVLDAQDGFGTTAYKAVCFRRQDCDWSHGQSSRTFREVARATS